MRKFSEKHKQNMSLARLGRTFIVLSNEEKLFIDCLYNEYEISLKELGKALGYSYHKLDLRMDKYEIKRRPRGIFTVQHKHRISESKMGHLTSEETRKKIANANRQISIDNWKNPEISARRIKNTLKACHIKPNKSELFLENILDNHFPNEWKYVGGGEVIIGRMCPDFINTNGKKCVIEMFGNYWHKEENPQYKIDKYMEYGFECLVIWESELKNCIEVINKITRFIEGKETPIVDGEVGKKVLEICLKAKGE